jgi:hypothetical protein
MMREIWLRMLWLPFRAWLVRVNVLEVNLELCQRDGASK